MSEEMWNTKLSEYIKQGEPDEKEKAKTWEVAIGLQDVDGLKTSEYLLETAKDHIEGNIDIKEAKNRINSYYKTLGKRKSAEKECEEADKVSVRITELLSDNSFTLNPTLLSNIHKRLFEGIYDFAGTYRDYNITKEEWVLNNDTIIYSDYENIQNTLEYDFNEEKNFSYKNLSIDELVDHLCKFISNLWQIHPFGEGNTRTIAVFLIKYLRTFGFNVNNDVFKDNSWYFRNALVRANYKKYEKNIYEDYTYLKKFLYNLVSNTKYELKNRYTHVDYEVEKIRDVAIVRESNYILQDILKLLLEDPKITQVDISKKINRSLRTVKTYMDRLQKESIIERSNGKRNGFWIVKDNYYI